MSAAPIVPARVAANRQNAQRSTGPRTAAGKSRSRANAVKHGLTGAGVALSTEDAALVEAEFTAAQADFAPSTRLGAKLVRRAALLSVRLDRCERYGQAADEQRIRHAASRLDRARAEHADRLLDAIEADPRTYRRALLTTPEGVDRLCGTLNMLIEELVGPALAWSPGHHKRLDALFGFKVTDIPWNRPTRFSRALLGDFGSIGDDEMIGVPEDERQGWALVRLVTAIEAEIEALAAHRGTLDHAALAADRLAAPDLALFDADHPGELTRRYEQATARELSRTIRDFHLVEGLAAPVDEPEDDAPAEPPAAAAPPAPPDRDCKPGNDNEIGPMASFGETPAEPTHTSNDRPACGATTGLRVELAAPNPPATR